MFSVDRFWPQAQPAGWQRWMLHEAEFAAERRAGPQLYLARLPGQARAKAAAEQLRLRHSDAL